MQINNILRIIILIYCNVEDCSNEEYTVRKWLIIHIFGHTYHNNYAKKTLRSGLF